ASASARDTPDTDRIVPVTSMSRSAFSLRDTSSGCTSYGDSQWAAARATCASPPGAGPAPPDPPTSADPRADPARPPPAPRAGAASDGSGRGQDGLGGGGPGDRHAEGRAADVVDARPGEDGDRLRVATVLAAHAHLEARSGLPPALHTEAHQLTDPSGVDG